MSEKNLKACALVTFKQIIRPERDSNPGSYRKPAQVQRASCYVTGASSSSAGAKEDPARNFTILTNLGEYLQVQIINLLRRFVTTPMRLVMRSVTSVCPVRALTFESFDLKLHF